MEISRRSRLRLAIVIALALVGAGLMTYLDNDGTTWLKFALYAVFFVAIFLAAVLSPVNSCGWLRFRRQPKT
jgi:hypothetical protein